MTDYVGLEQLLCCQRAAGLPLVLRAGQSLSWGQWRQRVAQWQALLDQHDGERFALYHPDAFEFSAILFALWASRKIACVPGANQPVITEQLRPRVAGFIGDFPLPESECLAPPAEDAPAADASPLLDRNRLVLEVFTSGSTGEPQAIPKRLSQMANEVDNLQACWAATAEGALTVGTVSHHHIYGLLFRVLWPLAAGRRFESGINDYLEALNTDAAADGGFVLISSPSHLSRILESLDWSPFRRHCRAIFSSGAPLPREASLAARSLLAQPPIEVYGSSETGGIAWRQQEESRELPWTLFPGMEITVDEQSACLQLRSPYLPAMAAGEWYPTSDRISREPDGRFHLRGRADRIAKIEGKRVSLTAMEKRLESHPAIEQARLVVLSGRRSELGAVVVLSEGGRKQLEAAGRRQFNSQLTDYLLQEFERPVLPRRWRYPDWMPRDSQGKVIQRDLAALFGAERQGRPVFPDVLETRLLDDEGDAPAVHLRLRIPEDLFYFQGHFPVAAILPGVVQLQWARHYGRQLLQVEGEFSHLEGIKFQHVVRPLQELELQLSYAPGKNKLSFRYHSASGQHASGRLVFHPPQD